VRSHLFCAQWLRTRRFWSQLHRFSFLVSPSNIKYQILHPSCCRTKDALCLSEAGETSLSGGDGTSEAGPHLHRAQEAQPGKAQGMKIKLIRKANPEKSLLTKSLPVVAMLHFQIAMCSPANLSKLLSNRNAFLPFRTPQACNFGRGVAFFIFTAGLLQQNARRHWEAGSCERRSFQGHGIAAAASQCHNNYCLPIIWLENLFRVILNCSMNSLFIARNVP